MEGNDYTSRPRDFLSDAMLGVDETLARQLPLPLAQLYRRAHNAKSSLERHLTAFSLWEASLKLLASTAIVRYAQRAEHDEEITEQLKPLARPSLGHWRQFLRILAEPLAEDGDGGFQRTRELLESRRDDLPRMAGLDAAMLEVLGGKRSSRATVQVGELFDRFVTYRNKVLFHAAPGQLSETLNERMSQTILAGLNELFNHLDPLAGRNLVYVSEVRPIGGQWLIECFELRGENPRRCVPLELPRSATPLIPNESELYLQDPQRANDLQGLTSLHPLIQYVAETEEVLFLNSRPNYKKAEYLCYTTGKTETRKELTVEQQELFASILAQRPSEEELAAWASASREEDSQEDDTLSDKSLGEFELLSELGRGGMGVVFRAWQPSLRRQVALKRLLQTGDERTGARFQREIRALGRVEHPNLVKVFSAGADGEHWFYAMELVEGAPLSDVCDYLQSTHDSVEGLDAETWKNALSTVCEKARSSEKPLSNVAELPGASVSPVKAESVAAQPSVKMQADYVRQVVELVAQAARAAHSLHQAGVIHRDIKPGNIMVTEDGRHAVLMDLGLAQLADADEGRLTRTRQFVGTLRYASPQQVLSIGELDCRTDIYSLGATLWEMLTLQPLYGATDETPTPELMERIQRQDPRPVRTFHPGVSKDLEAIVHKCLEKSLDKRYTTAAELADDLDRYLAGDPVTARPPNRLERKLRWIARHPERSATIALGALAMVLLVVGSAFTFFWRSAVEAHQEAESARRAAEEARGIAEQRFVDLQHAIEDKDKAQSQERVAEREAKRSREREIEARKREREVASMAARNFVDRAKYEIQLDRVASGLHWLNKAFKTAPADDPVRLSARKLMGAWSRTLPVRLQFDGDLRQVIYSPDGRYAATSSGAETRVWDLEDGRPVSPSIKHTVPLLHYSVTWNSTSERLVTVGLDGSVRLWDPRKGEQIGGVLWPGKPAVVWSEYLIDQPKPEVRFVGQGDWFLTLLNDGGNVSVKLWDAHNGKSLGKTLHHSLGSNTIASSPGGNHLVTRREPQQLELWNIKALERPVATIDVKGDPLTRYRWSPDGRTLAVADNGRLRVYDAASGKQIGPELECTARDDLLFNSSGTRLLVSDFHAWQYFDLDQESSTGPSLDADVQASELGSITAMSTASERLCTERGNRVVLWNLQSGKIIREIRHDGEISVCQFSADGRLLITACDREVTLVSDALTGRQIGPGLVAGRVHEALFDDAGVNLATLSDQGVLNLWNARTLDLRAGPITHSSRLDSGMKFMPDGSKLLLPTGGDQIVAASVADGHLVEVPTNSPGYDFLARSLSPDGEYLIVESDHGLGLIETVDLGGRPRPLKHETNAAVTRLVFGEDENRLVTICDEYNIDLRLWNSKTGQMVGKPLKINGELVRQVRSPDGNYLFVSDEKASWVWRLADGRQTKLSGNNEHAPSAAAFSSQGRILALGDRQRIRLWDVSAGSPLGDEIPIGCSDSLRFSPDGKTLLSDGHVLLDVESGKQIGTLDGWEAENFTKYAMSDDGAFVATIANDGRLELWDGRTGERLSPDADEQVETLRVDRRDEIAFSPHGRWLLSYSGNEDLSEEAKTTVRVWLSQNGDLRCKLPHKGRVEKVSFDENGDRVLLRSQSRVALWDVTTDSPSLMGQVSVQGDEQIKGAALAPQGGKLLIGFADRLQYWDVALRKWVGKSVPFKSVADVRFTFEQDMVLVWCAPDFDPHVSHALNSTTLKAIRPALSFNNLRQASYSPNYKLLLVESDNKQMRLWDLVAGKPIGAPLNDGWEVKLAIFQPSGNLMVTWGHDRLIRFWNTGNAHQTGDALRLDSDIETFGFSPDGRFLHVLCNDRTLHSWSVAERAKLSPVVENVSDVRDMSIDGKLLLLVRGKYLQLWNVESGQEVGEPIRSLRRRVATDARFAPDGQTVVFEVGGQVLMADARTGNRLAEPLHDENHSDQLIFRPGGSVVSAIPVNPSSDPVQLWSTKTGKRTGHPIQLSGDPLIVESNDERLMAVTSHEDASGFQTALNLSKGSLSTGAIVDTPLEIEVTKDRQFKPVAFSPDQSSLAIRTDRYKSTNYFDLVRTRDGEVLASNLPGAFRNYGDVTVAAFTPDSKRFLLRHGNTLHAYRTDSPDQARGELVRWGRDVYSVAFSADSRRLAVGTKLGVQVYDARTLNPVGELYKHPQPVDLAMLKSDGNRLVTRCHDGAVRLWNTKTGQLVGLLRQHHDAFNSPSPKFVSFVDQGDSVFTVGWESRGDEDGAWVIRKFDAETGEPLSVADGPANRFRDCNDRGLLLFCERNDSGSFTQVCDVNGFVLASAFTGKQSLYEPILSPDGKTVFIFGGKDSAQVRNADTLELISDGSQFGSAVEFASFALQSHRLVTIQKNELGRPEIRVWDLPSCELAGRVDDSTADKAWLSPDGTIVTTYNEKQHVLRDWDVATGTLLGRPFRHLEQYAGYDSRKFERLAYSNDGRSRCFMYTTGDLWIEPVIEPVPDDEKSVADWLAIRTGLTEDVGRLRQVTHNEYHSAWGRLVDQGVPFDPPESVTGNDRARWHRMRAQISNHSPSETLFHLERLASLESDNSEVWMRLAEVSLETRRWRAAIDAYDRVREIDPGRNHELLHGRGRAFAELGQWDSAISEFQAAIRHSADQMDLRVNLALAQLARRGLSAYRERCSELKQLFSETDDAKNADLLAYSLALDPACQDIERVVKWARQAVESKRESGIFRETLGAALYRAGEYDDAWEELRVARNLLANGNSSYKEATPWLQFFLSMTAAQRGEQEISERWLKAAQVTVRRRWWDNWQNRLRWKILSDEAAQVIQTSQSASEE